jgi:hypothetical protein
MPIPLGVLAVAGAGAGPVAAGNAYEWLETQVLGTAVAFVEFTNVNTNYASTYQHLQVRMTTKSTLASGSERQATFMRFNSDTGNNYSRHVFFSSDGAGTVGSAANASISYLELPNTPTSLSNTNGFSGSVIDILDPFETTKNKTIRSIGGYMTSASAFYHKIMITGSTWYNTSAITTIRIYLDANSFSIGSRFSLYGMKG